VIGVGDAIRVFGGTKPNRPGVVLRLLTVDGLACGFVALGTSKPPPDGLPPPSPVFIGSGDDALAALGLDVPTWFRAGSVARVVAVDPTIRVVGTCPPATLIALRELYGFR
jgi:hypothetical protein